MKNKNDIEMLNNKKSYLEAITSSISDYLMEDNGILEKYSHLSLDKKDDRYILIKEVLLNKNESKDYIKHCEATLAYALDNFDENTLVQIYESILPAVDYKESNSVQKLYKEMYEYTKELIK